MNHWRRLYMYLWGGLCLCGLLFGLGQSACVLSTTTCTTGDDCPPPFQVCVNATCVVCRVDNDCAGSLVCINSSCVASPQDGASKEQSTPDQTTRPDAPPLSDAPGTPDLPDSPLPPERREPPETRSDAQSIENACTPGQERKCYTGDPTTQGQGSCKGGTQTCDTSGQWRPCTGQVLPQKEVCNNLDDDCNGNVDDGCPCRAGQSRPCGLAGGACKQGTQGCQNGNWGPCVGSIAPKAEVCDGIDNDCNGKVDDSIPGIPGPCKTGQQGACAEGRALCTRGRKSCQPIARPSAETCDNKDNDCDGQVDEGIPGMGRDCVVPKVKGPCTKGKMTCVKGKISCVGLVKPAPRECPGVADRDCDGMLDCEIPISSGSYMRGAIATDVHAGRDERPQHRVVLTQKFTVWQHKVTQGEYNAIMKANPSRFKACGANCPVERVSWNDALAFANALSKARGLKSCYDCRTLLGKPRCTPKTAYQGNNGRGLYKCPGFRLPTDAEWEYVARAGTTAPLYSGKHPSSTNAKDCHPDANVSAVAWFCHNSTVTYAGCRKLTPTSPCVGPSPVQKKPPNPWKIYDMLGNLREWVYDDAAPYRNRSMIDPIKIPTQAERVVRGASYGSNATFSRVSNRRIQSNGNAQDYIGFRVIRTIP